MATEPNRIDRQHGHHHRLIRRNVKPHAPLSLQIRERVTMPNLKIEAELTLNPLISR